MLLLSTSSLKGYGMHKIFSIVSKSNFDGIDLVIDRTNYDTLDEEYLLKLSQEFNVKILSITLPDRGLDQNIIEQALKMANSFNSQVLNFSPPHINDKNMDWYLNYLSRIKKDSGKSIALQNIEQKFMLFVIPEYKNSNLIDLKKITGNTSLNISNIDKTTGIDLLKAYSMLQDSIVNIYLSDKNGQKDELLPGNAGGGISHLPIESFFMKLKTSGYNGFFSLKVKPQELGAGNELKVLESLEQVKKYYTKHFLDYKVS